MGCKLLLADDSITIQKVVGIIFASEDYHLTIVDNGAAVLAKQLAKNLCAPNFMFSVSRLCESEFINYHGDLINLLTFEGLCMFCILSIQHHFITISRKLRRKSKS